MYVEGSIFIALDQWRQGLLTDADLVAQHSCNMRDYLEYPQMREKISRLRQSRLGIKTSADLLENTRIETIEQHGAICSRLIWIDSSPSSIGTLSGHSLGYAVDIQRPFIVETFAVLGTGDVGDIPSKPEISLHSSCSVSAGSAFLLKAGAWAYRISGLDNNSLIHRIDAESELPFNFTFDRASLEFTSVSFSDVAGTRDDFFIQLAGAVGLELGRGNDSLNWSGERTALIKFLETASASREVNIFSRWKAIQSLGKINPPSAITALEAMATSGTNNARQRAARALQNFRTNRKD